MADKAGNILWDQVVKALESKRCGTTENHWVDKCLNTILEILTGQHVQKEEKYL